MEDKMSEDFDKLPEWLKTLWTDNPSLALVAEKQLTEADAAIAELVEALRKANGFISTWRDCLDGVQMNREDFMQGSNIIESRALIAKWEKKE
jgi:hypothetical protein